MPILEKYEVQQNRIWYRVEVTEEQKAEYLKWQADKGIYHMQLSDEPEWMYDLEWDYHYEKPGRDEVISMEIVDE